MALRCLWGIHPAAWGLQDTVLLAGTPCPSLGAPGGLLLEQVPCARHGAEPWVQGGGQPSQLPLSLFKILWRALNREHCLGG